jgi:antitoxin VapB
MSGDHRPPLTSIALPTHDDRLRTVAAKLAINKTEAVARALRNELQRVTEAAPLRARLKPIQDRVMARPATGQQADKAFFDELSGDL